MKRCAGAGHPPATRLSKRLAKMLNQSGLGKMCVGNIDKANAIRRVAQEGSTVFVTARCQIVPSIPSQEFKMKRR